jgi:hypothetical protein
MFNPLCIWRCKAVFILQVLLDKSRVEAIIQAWTLRQISSLETTTLPAVLPQSQCPQRRDNSGGRVVISGLLEVTR